MNDKPNTLPGWNLLGPGNNGTPTDKAAERPAPMSAEEEKKLRTLARQLWIESRAGHQGKLWQLLTAHTAEQAAGIARLRDISTGLTELLNKRNAESDAMRATIARLEPDLAAAKATIAERNATLDNLKRSSIAKVAALEAEKAELKETVEERHLKACNNENLLQQELVAHAATKADRDPLRSQAAALEKERDERANERNSFRDQRDSILADRAEWIKHHDTLRDRVRVLEEERLAFAEKCFIAGCESADERISYDYAHGRWQTSYLRSDLISEQTALAPDLSTGEEGKDTADRGFTPLTLTAEDRAAYGLGPNGLDREKGA